MTNLRMDIDLVDSYQNNKSIGVRDDHEFESEIGVERERGGAGIRDKQASPPVRSRIDEVEVTTLAFGAGPPYPHPHAHAQYGLNIPDRSTGEVEAETKTKTPGLVTTTGLLGNRIQDDHDSLQHHNNGIDGDLDASGNGYRYSHQNGNRGPRLEAEEGLDSESIHNIERGQRSRGLSIDDLITRPPIRHLPHPHPHPTPNSFSNSNTSTLSSVSPATPEAHPSSPYRYQLGPGPGSIHSPVPIRSRPSFAGSRPGSALGSTSTTSTARPVHYIYNRRPGPIHASSSLSSRQRASPYPPTSAARYEGIGLGIDMINTPSTPSHSGSPLNNDHDQPDPGNVSPTLQSPGSMARRRKAPEWPEAKSSRSHSFNSASTPRDMYQTLKTPAALRVPTTAQLLSPAYRPGMESPMVIPGSGTGPGPIRRGFPPSSAPPLSAARIDSAIAPTPRRVHLMDVSRAKVISTLNERAGKYWFDPSTSDCRIYVPIPRKKAGPPISPEGTGESSDPRRRNWPPVPDAPKNVEGVTVEERNVVNTHHYYKSRRGSVPNEEEVPVLVFSIHRDYLVTQSNLLRSLLTATSPTRPAFPQSPITPQARSFPAPVLRMPKERMLRGSRVMPQRDGESVSVYMPIPDPASFGIVLHWIYWGDTPTLERALSQGLATWQGLVKNIEYLGLDDSIKRVIGKWWRTWVKTDVGRQSASESIDRRPSTSNSEVVNRKAKGRSSREFSVSSEGTTDDEREGDGMEVALQDGAGLGREEDDGGVGDLLKKL